MTQINYYVKCRQWNPSHGLYGKNNRWEFTYYTGEQEYHPSGVIVQYCNNYPLCIWRIKKTINENTDRL
jgi:hypothetical protein